MKKQIFLFDIGGTNMRIAASADGRSFGSPVILRTPRRFSEGMALLHSVGRKLSPKRNIARIVGGIAGSYDRRHGQLTQSPLRAWVGKPLLREFHRWGVPVTLENDSALVGLGEAVFGAGKGRRIVAYMTVSTGVGGVRIVEGRIDANALGFEPGHQIIAPDGQTCSQCGHRGDLQSFVGGRSLERRYGRPPKEIHDAKIWNEVAHHLAIGLVNVTVFWSPDVIVLGGSMFKTPGISVQTVRRYLKREFSVFPRPPRVVQGILGDVGGLWGALALAKDNSKFKIENSK